MATNKHAVIRYQTLDKCFRNPGRKYFIEDLINACNDALFQSYGMTVRIKRRQLFEDIRFKKSDLFFVINSLTIKKFNWIR
jgi:hypothetical protein